MLQEIDRICKNNDISYMLFAGTMLGAVRHNGFIPWDDDLDIVLLREEYDRLLEVAPKELNQEKFFLQKEYSEHWPCHFSKLRRNNTSYIEKTIPKDKKQHQGIYIDIFPVDNLSDNKLVQKIQFYSSKIVIAKSLHRRGYLTDSILKKAFILLCRLLPASPFLKVSQHRDKKDSEMVNTFYAASSKFEKSVFKREWFEKTKLAGFEDREYPISLYYDEVLSTLYGDYMKLPDEEERKCKVHALKIDFDNSYEKYLSWQENQRIDVYTRSIR